MSSARRSDHAIWRSSQDSPDVGGSYYNPVQECLRVGTPVWSAQIERIVSGIVSLSVVRAHPETFYASELWSALQSAAGELRFVFGIYDRGDYLLAPLLMNEERLLEFEVQVSDFNLIRVGFYGLDSRDADRGLASDFGVR